MANKINVIIDTNVIISALLSKKDDVATVQVLNLFYDGLIDVYYSDKILEEYEDVLRRKEFKIRTNIIDNIINLIKMDGHLLMPNSLLEKTVDIKDQPFYELVMDKNMKNGKLITGNIKHFPIKTNIMTPREFIEFYNKQKKEVGKN